MKITKTTPLTPNSLSSLSPSAVMSSLKTYAPLSTITNTGQFHVSSAGTKRVMTKERKEGAFDTFEKVSRR